MKTTLVIFGITGDLSTRKLLPALKVLKETGDFNELEIIGVSRRDIDVKDLLQSSVGSGLSDSTALFSMNLADKNEYMRLRDRVALQDDEQLLVYLSVPPRSATQIVDFLGEAGLNTPNVKLLFEKPFGVDLVSAQEAIASTARYYDEGQIYRIDHYLAKEMAQNIVALRGGNALLSNVWNNQMIERIEIIASETIGVEGRAQFYEQTGALRDIMQGHLMQLLALTLMDIPDNFDWEELPLLRTRALEMIQPADPMAATRGQYSGYQSEVGNLGSTIETFVSVTLESLAPQWQGVPIILTTGKALNEKTTEVRIYLKKHHEAQSNRIVFHIQPNEGIEMDLFTKKPGYDREFEVQQLGFTYANDIVLPEAYEQVLSDAALSRKSLFASSEEVICSWQILQPLLDAWSMESEQLSTYVKGSSVAECIASGEVGSQPQIKGYFYRL